MANMPIRTQQRPIKIPGTLLCRSEAGRAFQQISRLLGYFDAGDPGFGKDAEAKLDLVGRQRLFEAQKLITEGARDMDGRAELVDVCR